ncbi:unnamed protein product [Lymnaea stagnalis]|uniref:PLAC domain-containing protein n=1 Tax=Lymnaea stagnalis TaxID=6523 RepID=A0AAV2HUW1_LYMST
MEIISKDKNKVIMLGKTLFRSDSKFLMQSAAVVVLLCQAALSVSAVEVSGVGQWSSWSACSSSCGQGIASRSRNCGGESITTQDSMACIGRSSQGKICFLQECPTGRPSARELACSHYNSRVFSGKRYSWEPFIHPTDPCKLTCRAKGVHFYANLPARLGDGESCSTGQIKAVCVKGLCQVVGCDDLVASRAVKDKCGVCKGDNSSCKTISGIFTSTELKRGLNDIMNIPAGSTSINITELMASRNSLILEDSSGQTFINGETKSPTSGDVIAAGAVFSYAARSPTNSKESVVSLGPTNETITLKLLLRDITPGIIYTFSVPNILSDVVLRQITHRSQPIEVASGAEYTLESQGGVGVQSAVLAASQDGPEDRHMAEVTMNTDVMLNRTTTASTGVESAAHQVTPTSANFKDLKFKNVSKAETLNNTNLVASLEDSPKRGKPIDDINEASGNATIDLRPDSLDNGGNTSVNVQERKQTETVGDVLDKLETPSEKTEQAADVDGSVKQQVTTSERPDADTRTFVAEEISSIKNVSDRQNSVEVSVKGSDKVQPSELDRPHLDTPNKEDSSTETLLAPKILVVTRDASQYHLPKYSQTFNYHAQQGAQRGQISHQENSREQDTSRSQDDSQNIQPPKIVQKSSPQRRSEFRRSQQLGTPHFGSLNSGRGDRISAFGTSLNQVGGTPREDPGRQRARAERQRQLQERQILEEQRRRRIEHQEELYNQRLREYNKKLQRRAEMVATRQQRWNGARAEAKLPGRSHQSSDRQEEHQRGSHGNRKTGTVTHETAFNVALTDAGPVVTKVRDQKIETPRDPDESSFRQQTDPEPTRITLKGGPIFAQPEGLTDDTQDGNEVINKAENYDVDSDLSKRHPNGKHGDNGDGSLPISVSSGHDAKSEPGKDSNNIEDLSTTSRLESNDKEEQSQRPDEETELAKPPLYNSYENVATPKPHQHPSYENGATDVNDGAFITIRQRPKPAGPRYIPVASPESSALTGNDIRLDQSSETISNDLSLTNQISSEYRPPNNEVFPSNILPNQISLTSEQNSRNTAYEWRISGLTECTHSCGGGAQRTVVVCIDIFSQAVVTDENCRHLIKPEVLTLTCNKRPCPAVWTPGPWTPCTVTCGKGEQTRIVTCQARVSPTLNLTMPVETCDNQDQLPSRQLCNSNPCSSWRVGNWSSCSAGCGDAQRSRDVDCVDTANNVVTDEMCKELKPISEERCNLGECGKGWLFTDWPEECPAQCGTGRVTRHLFCGDDDGNPLPDHRCDVDQRPADNKSCRASRPCGGIWFTGQWSKCNTTCGSGYKKRDVICIKSLPGSLYAVVPDDNCETSIKPLDLDQCQGPVCASQWYMTSWTQCSQTCGTGYRTREVKCLNNVQQPDDTCPLDNRPKTRDPCNTHQCSPVTASSVTNSSIALENKSCEDKSQQCAVVQRARLCRYRYYQRMCCKSCAAADDS